MNRDELIDLADTYVSLYVMNAEHYDEEAALIHETGIDENELKSILINNRLSSDEDVESMSEEQLDAAIEAAVNDIVREADNLKKDSANNK